ncbi:ABC transporter substrate-binding protein [Chloroflexota bacterium]
MRKRILLTGLSFLLVVALVLAGCGGPAVVEEEEAEVEEEEEVAEEVEEEVVTPAEGVPQYGGTLIVFNNQQAAAAVDPPSADIAHGHWLATQWLAVMLECPLMADFEKYGPRGTNEYAFANRATLPQQYARGAILESWEVHPDRLVWNVRPGVMWHDNPYLGFDFESREVTADDVVADMEYFRVSSAGKSRFATLQIGDGDINATDKYTVVINWGGFNADWDRLIGWEDRATITPPECEEAGLDKWKNQVGTGPWMFKEYVVGTSMSFARNPNYWDTTEIDGVEYEIPFIDELVLPIIPDAATQTAAFRTGAIDFFYMLYPEHWESMEKLAPEILSNKAPAPGGWSLNLNVTEPPFDNIEIRQAMNIGTHRSAFAALQDAEDLPEHFVRVSPFETGVYTPMEELPTSIRELYDYDPEKARQMISDAGYPDGIETDLILEGSAIGLERASLLQHQWSLFGVTLEIRSLDSVQYRKLVYDLEDKTYGVALHGGGASSLYHSLSGPTTGYYTNFTGHSDPVYDEMVTSVMEEIDLTERTRLAKETSLYILDKAISIGLNMSPAGHFWWPWIKNYYGERNTGDNVITTVLAYAWLDEDLKEEMGFK